MLYTGFLCKNCSNRHAYVHRRALASDMSHAKAFPCTYITMAYFQGKLVSCDIVLIHDLYEHILKVFYV